MTIIGDGPFQFRGSPRVVEGLIPFNASSGLSATLSFNIGLKTAAPSAIPLGLDATSIGSSATRLQFSLPESTLPGTYQGNVQINGKSYPITVEVEPRPYLVISPRQLFLQVVPGGQASVGLTLVNSGNVACDIAKVHAFGLFDVGGVERSIGAALRDPVEKGQGRFNRLLEEAAGSHGGLVRVSIKTGTGNLEPGELREIHAELHFSDHLKLNERTGEPGHL